MTDFTSETATSAAAGSASINGHNGHDPFADAAPVYREKGWPGVLPLPERAKYPPPSGYTGRNDKTPTAETVGRWAQTRTNANVALRLPDTAVGLDVDAYGDKTGKQTLAEAETRWGALPPTFRSTSREDGVSGIRLYRIPAGTELPGCIKFDLDDGSTVGDIEIVQHHHRYMVVEPSVHPEGGTYRWLDEDGNAVGIPAVDDLPELPPGWLEGLAATETPAPTPNASERGNETTAEGTADCGWVVGEALTEGRMSPAVRAWLVEATEAVTDTSRYDHMVRLTLAALRLGRQGEPGVRAGLLALRGVYVDAVADDRDGGERAAVAEFNRAVGGAGNELLSHEPIIGDDRDLFTERGDGGQADGDAGSAAADGGLDPELEREIRKRVTWLQADREARRRIADVEVSEITLPPVRGLDALLAEPDDPTRMRIERVWPAGGAKVLCAGAAGAGKTTLSGNLVRSLADGEPFLGAFTVHQRAERIVIIDLEMTPGMLKRWMRRQGVRNTAVVVDVVNLRGQAGLFDIGNDRLRDMWTRRLGDLGCDLLIFDCLSPVINAMGLDENRELGKFLHPMTDMSAAAGVDDLLVYHHMGHGAERARGDSTALGWSDGNWNLSKDTDHPLQPRYFSTDKVRDADDLVQKGLLSFDPRSGHLTYTGDSPSVVRHDGVVEERLTAVLDFLADSASDDGETTTAIKAAVGGKKDITAAALKLANERGKVAVTPKGRSVQYKIKPDALDPLTDAHG